MSSPAEDPKEPREELRAFLYSQTRILDALITALTTKMDEGLADDDRTILNITLLMVQSLGVSFHSILKLTDTRDMAIRDAYGIARSSSELAVNVCFIVATGAETARRAERHALQKSFRDLDRSGSIGGFEFAIKRTEMPKIEEVPGLSEAISEFSDRKGREVRDWTPLSLSERIKAVQIPYERCALALTGAVLSIYRHSSELLHGTYFGVVHFWRASRPPAKTRAEFECVWDDHFIAIFSAALFSGEAVVEAYGQKFGLDELRDDQLRLIKEVKAAIANTATPRNAPVL